MPTSSRAGTPRDPVYEKLRDDIISGRLGWDVRLVENTIAAALNVSRTPVRRALDRLENERLLVRHSDGSRVVARPTPQDIVDIYEVRAALEGLAARSAAVKITETGKIAFKQLFTQIERAIADEDVKRQIVLNARFHQFIAELTQNQSLIETLQLLRNRLSPIIATSSELTSLEIQFGEHRGILDAILAQDPDTAERLMKAHMITARDARVAAYMASAWKLNEDDVAEESETYAPALLP